LSRIDLREAFPSSLATDREVRVDVEDPGAGSDQLRDVLG